MGTMNTAVQNPKRAKTGLILAGVLASASLVLLNSNARSKVKDTSKSMKDSVSKYATTIKDDPNGTRKAIITRVQNATEISKEAINKIQEILDTQVKDIKDTTKDVVDDTKEVFSTAKEAQSEFKEVKDKSVDAKDELLSTKDDIKSNSYSSTENTKQSSNNTNLVTKTPVR
ncbi:hypothetical protein [Oceanobacillus massiliensis]|uniref:hypothetical protein n=1 Tax=Oceanobacillus massiliensis TaxID=1465765 RepID=UPI0002886D6E|nr:hypothetical protein [Oceanobacillus massiliensis]